MIDRFKEQFRQSQISLLRMLDRARAPEELYMMFLAAIVGVLTGLGAYALNLIVDGVHDLLYTQVGQNLFSVENFDWLRILFPAAGGLFVGLMTYYLSPDVKGHGIPDVIEAIATRGGMIRKRVSILTSINSGATIGSGGSAGKEGPIVQIGAALGSIIGQLFHVSQRRLKILVGCGSAAGLAAVFNAPVAGVVFAIEIILADFRLAVFTPIVISSVIATAIARDLVGSSPLFQVPAYAIHSPWEFMLYILMGIFGGMVAVFFTKSLYGVEDFFHNKIKAPAWVKPAIGGLITGLIAFKLPELYGFDDSATYTALVGRTEIYLFALLVFAKIMATSFTLGSGGTGGLFTPSLFIGAMFGALFGSIAQQFFPGIAPPGAYALVGMGVIVAATIHAPLSAFLIIFEITSNYHIILPLMLATVTATVVARWLLKESIYTMKIAHLSKMIEGGHNLEMIEDTSINGLINRKAVCFRELTSFHEIVDTVMSVNTNGFPVVDDKKRLLGIITLRDLRPVLFDQDVAPLLTASDVMSPNIFVLEKNDTMAEALRKMDIDDDEVLPVVDTRTNMTFLGTVSRADILLRYTKEKFLVKEEAANA